ncbi:amino acid ABC transporter permease [Paenibacillus hamazuiensis]|uniref:amino acid ABC transporter permease n=1 Tax=Paenibacillus hamazuiensis TaxID=2936508 RepID=UPI0023E03064|nr:amino acid ABC transporter permease [Paenibacillus hamazuiensis]
MDWSVIYEYRHLLWSGFMVTCKLSVTAILLGTLTGIVISMAATGRLKWLKAPLAAYVQLFRGSPLLIQLFMFYFGLSYIGINIDVFEATALVFTLYSGAYIAEIFRAGIESVPKGQFEAAKALGFSYTLLMFKIILPQTLKIALPPLIGFYITLIKDTSIASVVGYAELLNQGKAIMNIAGKPFEILLSISLVYFIICYPLSLFVTWMERRIYIK